MSRLNEFKATLTSPRAQGFYYLVVAFAVAVGALYGSYIFNGIVNTIAYAIVFLLCIGLIPTLISLFGSGIPGSASLGRAHIVLGAFAFDHHYLVQLEDRWGWCPGDDSRVYIEGQWHDIDGGLGNKSVLGWRPFGVLRYKDDNSLSEIRVDQLAERQRGNATADGGVVDTGDEGMTRGGWQQKYRPTVTGRTGTWLVDLKRVYSSGIKKIGDIELIETAEEIIERGQVNDSGLSGLGPMVTFTVALFLGILAGGVILFLG